MKPKKRKSVRRPMTEDQEADSTEPDRDEQEIILGLIASLHLNSEYSDLTIYCNGKEFPVHKLVVCPRSEYFHKACQSGFKEGNDGIIYLNDKDPILVEKMLEFLYTGDYTLQCNTRDSTSPWVAGGQMPEMDTEPAIQPTMYASSENNAFDEVAADVDGPADEIATLAQENTAESILDGSLTNVKPSSLNGSRSKNIPKQDDNDDVMSFIGSLADYYPCCFHARMYGEADYFRISGLESKAEAYFRASFMSSSEIEPFAETIREIYSTRANYQTLRQVAIGMIVNSLPKLRKEPNPALNEKLMNSIPGFTYELCQALIDKRVNDFNNMEEYWP